jgi:flagellar biosynthetic protein FliR
VTAIGPDTILAAVVIFCRVGACLMLMPGFSSPRVLVRVRLLIAIAITLALTPLILPDVQAALSDSSPVAVARIAVSETAIGALIGLLGRVFFIALETLATAMVNAIGLGNSLGAPIDENEPEATLVSFISLVATVLMFVTDQHWEIFRGLAASYGAMPVAAGFVTRFGLVQLADATSRTFYMALRISSPFIIFSIIVNVALGLTNKLTPQIPVYFISLPFVIAGGMFLLYFTCKEFLDLFLAAFSGWLATG